MAKIKTRMTKANIKDLTPFCLHQVNIAGCTLVGLHGKCSQLVCLCTVGVSGE